LADFLKQATQYMPVFDHINGALPRFDIVGEIINQACNEEQSIPDLSLGNQFANDITLSESACLQWERGTSVWLRMSQNNNSSRHKMSFKATRITTLLSPDSTWLLVAQYEHRATNLGEIWVLPPPWTDELRPLFPTRNAMDYAIDFAEFSWINEIFYFRNRIGVEDIA
jgi:hypothetical protein